MSDAEAMSEAMQNLDQTHEKFTRLLPEIKATMNKRIKQMEALIELMDVKKSLVHDIYNQRIGRKQVTSMKSILHELKEESLILKKVSDRDRFDTEKYKREMNAKRQKRKATLKEFNEIINNLGKEPLHGHLGKGITEKDLNDEETTDLLELIIRHQDSESPTDAAATRSASECIAFLRQLADVLRNNNETSEAVRASPAFKELQTLM
ncbi:MAG: hypothetical protein CL450_06545 [Acidimicrobiaceae bacterium]|nr:hypothetical protein [Acidimicrobiaceae bacterium]